jgi:hypothetical protein
MDAALANRARKIKCLKKLEGLTCPQPSKIKSQALCGIRKWTVRLRAER